MADKIILPKDFSWNTLSNAGSLNGILALAKTLELSGRILEAAGVFEEMKKSFCRISKAELGNSI